MQKEFYDIEGQKKRASQIRQLLIKNHVCDINEDGSLSGTKWLVGGGSDTLGGIAEWFYFCQGLWNESDEYGELTEKISKNFVPLTEYGTFEPFLCTLELIRNKKALSAGLIKRFEDYALKFMDLYLEDNEGFIGINDNTPILIAAGLILGGEYFKNKLWYEKGMERLDQLKNLLTRRGFLSEYNSLTYTPISLYGLASIVNYSENGAAREAALECEITVWERLAVLYQPCVCQTAGPYARAYPQDKLAKSYNMRFLMYILLGDRCQINPINTTFAEDKDENYYWQISCANISSMVYHCPKKLAEDMLNRSYPYIVRGDAETASSADNHLLSFVNNKLVSRENLLRTDFSGLDIQDDISEYSCGEIELYSYIDKNYSMGTATKDWHNGAQTDSFTILYSDGDTAECQEQVATIFANYTVNDSNINANDMGRKIAFQNNRTAMVLYRPKWCGKEVNKAGLNIVFGNIIPIRSMRVEDFEINPEILKNNGVCYAADGTKTVFVHTSDLYIMFKPLVNHKDAANASIQIASDGNNARISIFNVNTESKQFWHKKGFCLLTNGFICEVRRQNEYESFDDFISEMEKSVVSDKIMANIHTRYTVERTVTYSNGIDTMSMNIGMLTDSIKYKTVNGEQQRSTRFSFETVSL